MSEKPRSSEKTQEWSHWMIIDKQQNKIIYVIKMVSEVRKIKKSI